MAFAQSGAVRLHWESTGEGAPVLLVMGLGMTATGWWRTVPVLAESFRAIAFDNRGVGRSDRPEGPYSVPQMADDAVAVLDAAGEERAQVYGISLGGMIAQEVALRHPDRVAGLVLGATTPGGERAEHASEATVAFFRRRGEMPAEEAVWASVPYNYGPETRRSRAGLIGEDVERRLRYPVEPEPYEAQLEAALSHDALDRLGAVAAPTLAVHGEEDRMVPVGNGRILAEAIPGAELAVWPGAGHLYPTDEPRADRGVAEFLARVAGREGAASG
jgi:3-oxoadipate enol-lactonase